jgi:acyl phosphate:glycerol-3-phosphate acyltransferase
LEVTALDWVAAGLLGLTAYLIGSIPTAYIVVYWLKGVDIRQVGSKNVGALNTFHQVGIWGALVVLIVDAAKGTLAVLVPGWVDAPGWMAYLTTILVVIGHNWPIFLGFRGGKGVGTIFGISLVIVPQLTIIALGPTILLALLTRNMVIAVGTGFIVVNALAVATRQGPGLIALCLALTLLAVGAYIIGARGQISTAIKTRRFGGLFYGTNFNP